MFFFNLIVCLLSFLSFTSCFVLQIKSYYYFFRNTKGIMSVSSNFSKFSQILYVVHLTSAFVCCKYSVWVFNCRSILWGPAAVEHHKTRQSLGASLWKQVSSDDLLALLNTDKMLQTIAHFPQQRKIILQVGILKNIYFPKVFMRSSLKGTVHLNLNQNI